MSIANNAEVQVWVQGEKFGDQWTFDDGTLVTDFCPINSTNNGAPEVHLQARGSTTFSCIDAPSSDQNHYSTNKQRTNKQTNIIGGKIWPYLRLSSVFLYLFIICLEYVRCLFGLHIKYKLS